MILRLLATLLIAYDVAHLLHRHIRRLVWTYTADRAPLIPQPSDFAPGWWTEEAHR